MKLTLVKGALGECLVAAGFQKIGRRFVKTFPDCLLVVDIEKAKNSASSFIRCGFWLTNIQAPSLKLPSYGGFHIRDELRNLVAGADVLEDQLRDPDFSEKPLERRIDEVMNLCPKIANILLSEWTSESSLRSHYLAGGLKAARIQTSVRRYFGDFSRDQFFYDISIAP